MQQMFDETNLIGGFDEPLCPKAPGCIGQVIGGRGIVQGEIYDGAVEVQISELDGAGVDADHSNVDLVIGPCASPPKEA